MTFTIEQSLGLLVLTFACYRISTALAEDVGPWRIFERFREGFPNGWQYEGICCVGCVGFWVSAIAVLALSFAVKIDNPTVIWLAVAGGICFINRLAPCP